MNKLKLITELDQHSLHYRVKVQPQEMLDLIPMLQVRYKNPDQFIDFIEKVNGLIPPPLHSNSPWYHYFYIGREHSRVVYLEIITAYYYEHTNWKEVTREILRVANLALWDEFDIQDQDSGHISLRFWAD